MNAWRTWITSLQHLIEAALIHWVTFYGFEMNIIYVINLLLVKKYCFSGISRPPGKNFLAHAHSPPLPQCIFVYIPCKGSKLCVLRKVTNGCPGGPFTPAHVCPRHKISTIYTECKHPISDSLMHFNGLGFSCTGDKESFIRCIQFTGF